LGGQTAALGTGGICAQVSESFAMARRNPAPFKF
jgi:hypothetical protein